MNTRVVDITISTGARTVTLRPNCLLEVILTDNQTYSGKLANFVIDGNCLEYITLDISPKTRIILFGKDILTVKRIYRP